jgi:hypothetical protein
MMTMMKQQKTNPAPNHHRRIASNEVMTPENQTLTQYVVELAEDGTVCDLYPLTQELSSTEWMQGRLEIKNENGSRYVYYHNRLIK